MNQKTLWGIVVAVVVILLALWAWNARTNDSTDDMATTTTPTTTPAAVTDNSQTGSSQGSTVQAQGTLPNGSYTVDATLSTIGWTGSKPKVLGYEDTGTIDVESGALAITNGNIVSGEFVIDMESIATAKVSNKKGTTDALTTHLKSDDFFAVATYPTSRFVIKNVTNGVVTGELTIKATTKTISFPATITVDAEGRLVADAVVTLNRSLWDIRYGSGSFFDDLGDSLIADEMKLALHVVAGK
ncbi:MAG: YceI family protein [Candidatus Pacebacteria bacterium]|nr:YceI family protein [Candidatus Paceibacterota bacterium]